MKVVFMGTPDFAVPTLRALCEKHQVVAVVSQPDKPKGRGKKLQPTPVKMAAMEYNLPVYQPERIKDQEFIKTLKTFEADIFVVVAYGQILPEEILNIPPMGCVNVHGSLLPKYRGAAPIQMAIVNGEEKTGVTIMYMEKGLDSGDMILKKEIPIDKNDTYGTLHDKMCIVGAKALLEALELMEKGEVNPQKQEDSLSTYAPRIEKGNAQLVWERPSYQIINTIRGFNPVPGAFSFYKDEMVKIWSAVPVDGYNGKPGEIVDVDLKKGIVVKTGDSAVLITELQFKGGKKMPTIDYLRGHNIEKGEFFKFYQTFKVVVRK